MKREQVRLVKLRFEGLFKRRAGLLEDAVHTREDILRLHLRVATVVWEAWALADCKPTLEVAGGKSGAEDEIAGPNRVRRPFGLSGTGAFRIVGCLPFETGVAREGDRIDIQSRAMKGECITDFNGRPSGRIGGKILVPHKLELVEIGGINEMHVSFEHPLHRTASFSKHLLERLEAMPCLYFHKRRTDFVLRRVQSNDPPGLVHRINGRGKDVIARADGTRYRNQRHRSESF